MKASCFPSGEYIGRDSVAACETSSAATPPVDGTVQMSPPETNAISLRSGESDGSEKYGRCADAIPTAANRTTISLANNDISVPPKIRLYTIANALTGNVPNSTTFTGTAKNLKPELGNSPSPHKCSTTGMSWPNRIECTG